MVGSKLLKSKNLFAISFFISAFALGGAYGLEHFKAVQPCPLCIIQRILMGSVGLFPLIAFLHSPKSLFGIRIYSFLLFAFSGLGMLVAYRHISLYSLPPESLPSCMGSLGYLIEILPWKEALSAIWKGSDSCVQDTFQLFYLTIPEWAFMSFMIPFLLSIIIFIRKHG
ncbi:MAG: disulfide bond formation protein B [Gammaproteobacteria bacterium]|nr:disulfide bond formation protein B [Gammaproteobacteria bacterium]